VKNDCLNKFCFGITGKPTSFSPIIVVIFILSLYITGFIFNSAAYAQNDLLKAVEKKQMELKERETQIRQEEKRIEALKKDVDERIEKYSKILAQIENLLKKIEQAKEHNFEHLVKTYETMPPEEAAARLMVLDEELAVKIILKMKYKKAAAIMASMDTKKAANITQSISAIEKKFPTR
jgi:flagellar motility protein MotE (MotC chaperone)